VGWLDEAYPEHEGFVRGWQRVSLGEGPFAGSALREIVCPMPDEPIGARRVDVWAVQVCCECGWRSPLLRAPLGTEWSPCIVHFSERHRESEANDAKEDLIGAQLGRAFEKECRLAWGEHIASMMPGTFFSRMLHRRR
jgi:hypothetical protein